MQWLQRKKSNIVSVSEDEDEDVSESDENDKFVLLTDQEIPLVVEQCL